MTTGIIEKIKKIKTFTLLLLILIAIGIFLRSYNFSDWLHFEIDQSYDTLLVSAAVENGISSLPLLGPNAGAGRSLRLGPVFYYLEYLSAKIFGNTPPGHAMLVLICSVFSMPLFYLFCRRYFSKLISAGLLAVFCCSLYLVIYGRFSWNPNTLPFFILIAFYALLRSVDKGEKKRGLWFIVAATTIAIITQIHFNVFFTIPAIVAIFLIIKRPHFNWKIWLGAFAIFLIIYSPVIISDIKLNGRNFQFFSDKLNKKKSHMLATGENLNQVTQYVSSTNFMITSGLDYISSEKHLKNYGFASGSKMAWRIIAFVLFLLEIFLLLKNIRKEKNEAKKDFLILAGLWLFFTSAYFYGINNNYTIFPRFFLLTAPLAIILFGIIVEKIKPELNKKRLAVFLLIIAAIVTTNAIEIKKYFYQLSRTQIDPISVETEDVLPNTGRVTLSQQLAIIDYISLKYEGNGFPVYLQAKHEYEPAFWYHLEKRGIFFHQNIEKETIYKDGNYFLITFAGEIIDKYSSRFKIAEEKDFGSLFVYHLIPKEEFIFAEKQTSPLKISVQKKELAKIITWKKLFSANK